MEIDFAIIYFGLTRSTKKVYESHINNIYNVLSKNNLTYKTFMHTWSTSDNKQRVWDTTISQEIDYDEYKLLQPDFYKIEKQEDFTNNLDWGKYFYSEAYTTFGTDTNGEWLPLLILNHLCALESQKRALEMVEEFMESGYKIKHYLFIRPDLLIFDELPLYQILHNPNKITIPIDWSFEGYNDRVSVVNYENAIIYAKRINEIAEFRKTNGKIVSEKYLKFIVEKYNLKVNSVIFRTKLIRP